MRRRRILAHLLAAAMAASTASVWAPAEAEGATRQTARGAAARRPPAKKKPVARRTATKKKQPARRPTAAQRAAEKRRREAARREAARRRAAELERQRQALKKAWQPQKGCYQSGTVVVEPRLKDDDPIEVPKDARGGTMKAALLMYEAHVDKTGRLQSLRTLRPLPEQPPWPDLHRAAVSSLQGWRWERTKVAGKTIPVCFPVTLNLDLR